MTMKKREERACRRRFGRERGLLHWMWEGNRRVEERWEAVRWVAWDKNRRSNRRYLQEALRLPGAWSIAGS